MTQATAQLVVQYRILDMATREIRTANTWRKRYDRSELLAMDAKLGSWQVSTAIMQDMADAIVSEVLEIIYPVKVVKASSPQQIILNQGGERMEAGERFAVYNKGEVLIDPDTGESLGAEEMYCGIIEVMQVRPKFSIARWVEGTFEWVEAGAVCRPHTAQPASSTAPAAQPASSGSSRFQFPGSH